MPSPTELRDFLKSNHLSRQLAADICGVSIHTVHGWCAPAGISANRSIPASAWTLLRLYATPAGRSALAEIATQPAPSQPG